MSNATVIYKSMHRIKFSELDPYNHLRTEVYAGFYVDHRTDGLRQYVGWDLKTLAKLPFMVWVRRMEVGFIRPVIGDQEITITSFVREFHGSDALIECKMLGRMMALLMLASTGLMPILQAMAGTISKWNLTMSFVLLGALVLLLTIWMAFHPDLKGFSESLAAVKAERDE